MFDWSVFDPTNMLMNDPLMQPDVQMLTDPFADAPVTDASPPEEELDVIDGPTDSFDPFAD